jgi:hypothetical protein
MPATNPFPVPQRQAADLEAAKLLSRDSKGKPGKPLTSSNGNVARPVAGTKVSGKGATRTSGGSV